MVSRVESQGPVSGHELGSGLELGVEVGSLVGKQGRISSRDLGSDFKLRVEVGSRVKIQVRFRVEIHGRILSRESG